MQKEEVIALLPSTPLKNYYIYAHLGRTDLTHIFVHD
jgi:hypothetical protein